MIRPRASLLVAFLLAFAPAVWADNVNVTTVVDEDNGSRPGAVPGPSGPDTGCSLREAVAFLVQTQSPRPAYGGCTASTGTSSSSSSSSSSSGDTITLPASTTYQLTQGEIAIQSSMAITSAGQAVAQYPVIIAKPGNRVFSISHSPAATSQSSVTLSLLVLQGAPVTPAASSSSSTSLVSSPGCPKVTTPGIGQGGILYVSDVLTLSSMVLACGSASVAGGAIYVDSGSVASLTVTGSRIIGSTAPTGAAIYVASVAATSTASAAMAIGTSEISGNTATATGNGYIVDIEAPQNQSINGTYTIHSSTIGGNTGIALGARAGLIVDNATIVDNSLGGIDFNHVPNNPTLTTTSSSGTTTSTVGVVAVYNSIVAGNPSSGSVAPNDCLNVNTDSSSAPPGTVLYNLFSSLGSPASCGTFTTASITNLNFDFSTGPLLAGVVKDSNGNITGCELPDDNGILCPLMNNGGNTQSYLPRLPVVPTNSLAQDYALNLVVNRGSPKSDGSVCQTADQRGDSQRGGTCDIGAIAIQAKNPISVAFTTLLGQAVSGTFVSQLGDVPLLPAAACTQLPNFKGPAQVGCAIVGAAGKGTASLNQTTQDLLYVPGSTFYGTDTFATDVVTTLSRFTDANASTSGPYVIVNTVVSTQPVGGEQSKSTNGGALSPWQLVALALGMGVMSRYRQRVRS